MESILEGIENVDMGEVQKAFMNDPSLRQSAMEMLKNPNIANDLKSYFKGGSKWRNKHRKKRGSGGTHSTHEKKRRGAIVDLMENSPFGPLPHREAPEEKIFRLRKEAEAMKDALIKKEKSDIEKGTKVMYGGKWSLKYKRSINCRKPKGFSQKQYCKKKNRKSKKKRKKSRRKRKRKKRKTRRKRR